MNRWQKCRSCWPVKQSILRGIALLLCAFAFSVRASGQEAQAKLSYDRDIRPILAENCFACHGFDEEAREADLRLDVRQAAIDGGAIKPNDIAASSMIARVLSTDADELMPPHSTGKKLSNKQKELLKQWISEGADYQKHWAFEKPVKVAPPLSSPNQNPIDAFIQQRLKQANLKQSPQASPEVLLRRLSLDITGLPPTVEQIDQYVAAWKQDANAAYSQTVERLMTSPHYGERLGRWWLDQARYADSNGYSIDAPRSIWLYRDWVINALNADMPFDQFTIEQLAGDLLPDATREQKIATGFHRNTQINQEGGVDPEQFRIDSVFDRVGTTGTVWLGLTIGCAQCHNHKYDPITQQEYYQLFAFLNNQDEPELKIEPESGDGKPISTMILKERVKPRETHVFIKGDFTRPAAQVFPGTPSVLHPLNVSLNQNETTSTSSPIPSGQSTSQASDSNESDKTKEDRADKLARLTRLDLARWLVDRENPLTARVIVNRVWQHYFGQGLVQSENDFGLQGTPPTHPELLDWLAVEFMEKGWRLKDLQRLIVASETYKQSSKRTTDLNEADPYNLLLARQSRLRLEAEVVRDVSLTACGLLVEKLGGPPVYPPIPDGVMNQGQVKRDWKTSSGDDRYRRGVYTFVFRATPPPSLNVFDAPDGFSSCTRRIRSNTPLQALTLMNDSGFFEFAEALSKIIEKDGLAVAFKRCTSREPTVAEIEILKRLDTLNAARAMLNLDETISRE
ncbi:MAG: PSD1 and planctomycete cytochrome C domain-containing protein [Pirellulales bacterium]